MSGYNLQFQYGNSQFSSNNYAKPSYFSEEPMYASSNDAANQAQMMLGQSQPMYQTSMQPPPPYGPSGQAYGMPMQQTMPNQSMNFNAGTPVVAAAAPLPGTPGYKWPRKSTALVCPRCSASITTRLDRDITVITILAILLCWCFTCLLCWIPLIIPACKKTSHYCPYCGTLLGERRELS